MTLSDSRLAYQDCLDALDKALEFSKGAKIKQPDRDTAHRFRMRLHQARVLDRRYNRRQYDPNHPLYGNSVYDELTVRIKESSSGVYVFIEKMQLAHDDIEPIEEVEEATALQPESLTAVVEALDKRRV